MSFPSTHSEFELSEIKSSLKAIEDDPALLEEKKFDERADAIDFLDFHIIDRIEGLLQNTELSEELNVLKQRAEAIKNQLEKIDANLFNRLRENIRTGVYAKSSFREMVDKYVRYDISQQNKIGYDNLDVFIDGLLSYGAMPQPTSILDPDMVFLQKTPARIVFQLVELAGLRVADVFFDIGSGLGQVAILVNLLSRAVAKGIEYEPAYCSYSAACAAHLNLSNVEFINADARTADYADGNVFFLYTPFKGNMLDEMLGALKNESQKRPIRVFTYGPCSPIVAMQPWLKSMNGVADDPYLLYEFNTFTS